AALVSLGHFVGQNNDLSASARQDLVARLQEKEEHIQAALNLALNASMEATAIIPSDIPNQQNSLAISPGQKFDVHAKFHNGSKHPLSIKDIILDGITPAAVKEQTVCYSQAAITRPIFKFNFPRIFRSLARRCIAMILRGTASTWWMSLNTQPCRSRRLLFAWLRIAVFPILPRPLMAFQR